jgi:hypothetical protein
LHSFTHASLIYFAKYTKRDTNNIGGIESRHFPEMPRKFVPKTLDSGNPAWYHSQR